MTAPDRAALWRQRLVEAEAGMTDFLVSRHARTDLVDWLYEQSELLADLPDRASSVPEEWQRVFFRAQALMERFIVTRHGEGELAEWAAANSRVFGRLEPTYTGGPADVVNRIARQAELYSSVYDVPPADDDRATITISHCAIWDYREKARADGVRLTLDSPCSYCTHALSAHVRAKGFEPSVSLRSDDGEHGCVWVASRAG
jgi:hypothetical protein